MNELFWRLVAKLVTRPLVMKWLIRNAMKKPYFHLDGYMDRWWLTPRWLLTRDRYGNLFPYDWLPPILKARLHHIKRPDVDRHYHDHPADNRSIVLTNGYFETDVFGNTRIVGPGETVLRRAECFHKISGLAGEGGTYTIWFLGAWRQDWGFLVNGKKVYYKTYFSDHFKERIGVPFAFEEILYCQNHPDVLRAVSDYHGIRDTEWASVGDERYRPDNGHALRRDELRAAADKIESEY